MGRPRLGLDLVPIRIDRKVHDRLYGEAFRVAVEAGASASVSSLASKVLKDWLDSRPAQPAKRLSGKEDQ